MAAMTMDVERAYAMVQTPWQRGMRKGKRLLRGQARQGGRGPSGRSAGAVSQPPEEAFTRTCRREDPRPVQDLAGGSAAWSIVPCTRRLRVQFLVRACMGRFRPTQLKQK